MRDYRLYLDDIENAIKKIREYTDAISGEEFKNDGKTIDAVIRNLEIIGEAVKNLPDNLKIEHSDTDWRAIAGMRDIIAHQYFGVDYSEIWAAIKEDLPILENKIKKI